MNTTKENKRNNNKGFTLGEIITTVAIIGTITSMALPNYLRMKMNTNEEMVRQQMRIVGEKMVEIMGKEGLFPDSEEWPNLVGSEDELSLTASLSAIDDLCYTKTDYTTSQSRSTYVFCSQPDTSRACGKHAGYRKFCVHYDPIMSQSFSTGVVGCKDLWQGDGAPMEIKNTVGGGWATSHLLANPNLSTEEKVDYLVRALTKDALAMDLWAEGETRDAYLQGKLYYSTLLYFNPEQESKYRELLPLVYKDLEKKGIHMVEKESTLENLRVHGGYDYYNFLGQFGLTNAKVYEIGFKLDQHCQTQEDWSVRGGGGAPPLDDYAYENGLIPQ
jgi:prepilin-type N-terminal cleavage/methylation domain-containing protein